MKALGGGQKRRTGLLKPEQIQLVRKIKGRPWEPRMGRVGERGKGKCKSVFPLATLGLAGSKKG